MSRYFAIVPAAGAGTRLGAELPKQYLPLAGKPILMHTLQALCAAAEIERIWVVLSPQDMHWTAFDWTVFGHRVVPVFNGGNSRAASVVAGLQAAAGEAAEDDWILVHDAARPCLDKLLLRRLLVEVGNDPVGGILAIPVADTLKQAGADARIVRTVPRDGLWQAQTPQMFRRGLLEKALANADQVTDEASAVETLGLRPKLVPGAASNLKVTFAADVALAGWLLQEGKECR